MLNVMVLNIQPKWEKSLRWLMKEVEAQIENSMAMGWSKEKLLIVTNHPFEHEGATILLRDLNDFCPTGSKTFGAEILFKEGLITETTWLHDTDCWQTMLFDPPEFLDAGAVRYIGRFNGGSIFLKPSAVDIVIETADKIRETQSRKEEPCIRKVWGQHKDRITRLNSTWNVGSNKFERRRREAEKPIRVVHLHPDKKRMRRKFMPVIPGTNLKEIFMKHWPEAGWSTQTDFGGDGL